MAAMLKRHGVITPALAKKSQRIEGDFGVLCVTSSAAATASEQDTCRTFGAKSCSADHCHTHIRHELEICFAHTHTHS